MRRRSPPAASPTTRRRWRRQRDADPAIEHDNPLEEVFSDQLACADLVILNKTDLLAAAALAGLRADIEARLRPGGQSWSRPSRARVPRR